MGAGWSRSRRRGSRESPRPRCTQTCGRAMPRRCSRTGRNTGITWVGVDCSAGDLSGRTTCDDCAPLRSARVLSGRFPHDRLEVPDEMRLVEVAEVLRETSEVDFLATGKPTRRLVEAVSLDHPSGAHADVFLEQPLQGPLAYANPVHHVGDPGDRAAADDQF